MGERGPVPNRSEERRRRNKTDESGRSIEPEKLEVDAPPVTAPEPVDGWHELARAFWDDVVASPQSRYYERSDYAALRLMCEDMHRNLEEQPISVGSGEDARLEMVTLPMKGATLSAYTKIMASLLVTEGDRRRLQVEIERKNAEAELAPTADGVVLDRKALFQRGKK